MNKLSQNEIKALKKSGQVLAQAMRSVVKQVKPGMPTIALDKIAETEIRLMGGQPAFKNYTSGSEIPFPASLCVSLNDEIVHGTPTAKKVIREGDLVSLDLGCLFDGMYTDMALTVPAGKINDQEKRLLEVTKRALELGIKQAKAGKYTGDIGQAIQEFAEENGFSVVRDLVGHGVGKAIHMEPQIPNFGRKGTGTRLEEGMGLAIEPMVNIGKANITVSSDGWTILSRDGQKSAHFEQTIIVTKRDPIIITPF